jgi:hypothetical protein
MNQPSAPAGGPARHSRQALKPLITIAAALTLAGACVAVPAAASAAASAAAYSLSSGPAAVKAGGHTWDVAVLFASGATASQAGSLDVEIYRAAGKDQLEEHTWTFSVPNKIFSFSGGNAKLNAGSSASPLASVDVAFTEKSKKPETCLAGSGTVYTGTLKGSVTIKTGFKQTGTLRVKNVSFSAPNTVKASTGCVPPTPCLSEWISPKGGVLALGDTIGGPGDQKTTTIVAKTKKLSAKVIRVDGAVMTTAAPTFSGGTLHITTSSSGIITGSATMSGGTKEGPEALPCVTPNGKEFTEHITIYADPAFKSPAGIAAHTLLTGTLTSKKAGKGLFELATFTKA